MKRADQLGVWIVHRGPGHGDNAQGSATDGELADGQGSERLRGLLDLASQGSGGQLHAVAAQGLRDAVNIGERIAWRAVFEMVLDVVAKQGVANPLGFKRLVV